MWRSTFSLGLQTPLRPARPGNAARATSNFLSVSLPLCFLVAGVSEAENSCQDALALSKLGGQAEKNRKLQKK